MENRQNKDVCGNNDYYCNDLEYYPCLKHTYATSRQHISRLNRDVVEVTHKHGVGFVAVGRPVPKSTTEDSSSKSDMKQSSVMLTSRSAADLGTMCGLSSDKGTVNRQNYSVSLVDAARRSGHSDSDLKNFSNNTLVLAGGGCNYFKVSPDIDRQSNTTNRKLNKQQKLRSVEKPTTECFDKETTPHSCVHKKNCKSHSRTSTSSESGSETPKELLISKSAKIQKSYSFVHSYPLCQPCGQRHRLSENHEFDYVEEVDDDLQCDICLQPFIDPYDTKCGHTFCCVCLKNYVRIKKTCPVDRKDLEFVPSDCWQSSLVMRKLVDKLRVHCPNVDYCTITLPRSELAAHLKERCPGAILRCRHSVFGCNFKAARAAAEEHIKQCKFQHLQGDPLERLYPDCEKHVVELFRPEGFAELGFAIIGGNDTPVRNIIVQNIIPSSLVAEDGRIKHGDIIINVNGEDMHNINHVEARTILSRSSRLMRFTLLRERLVEALEPGFGEAEMRSERIAVSLLKPPSDQLGIKITRCDDGTPGIYIMELVPGHLAHTDGQLQVGDRIVEISHIDLWDGSPELAARVIQSSGERLDIVVSRQVRQGPVAIKNIWATDQTLPRGASSQLTEQESCKNKNEECLKIPFIEPTPMNVTFVEKVINVKKATSESLGIIVAGGMTGSRGDLPVFVQDVQPLGVLGKDKRIQRGDLLMEVNGISLAGLSHNQAISLLKETAHYCKDVSLKALELDYNGKDEDFALWEELSCVHHQKSKRRSSRKDASGYVSWMPSWRMWLAVPSHCRVPRDVVMRRSSKSGLGFSIVGGRSDTGRTDLPIFIKYVVPNSPAAMQGLRCGDEIVAINGRKLTAMTHSCVVQTLKYSPTATTLTIMSWPGSVH